jgi:hypothetical protein
LGNNDVRGKKGKGTTFFKIEKKKVSSTAHLSHNYFIAQKGELDDPTQNSYQKIRKPVNI